MSIVTSLGKGIKMFTYIVLDSRLYKQFKERRKERSTARKDTYGKERRELEREKEKRKRERERKSERESMRKREILGGGRK